MTKITVDDFITEWNDQVSRNDFLTNGTNGETLRYLEKCATESMVIKCGTWVNFVMLDNGKIETKK